MFMPATDSRVWTADEVRALPEEPGARYECVHGVLLMSPSPSLARQSVVGLLHVALHEYAKREAYGAAFLAPSDLELDRLTLLQPDLYLLPLVNGRRPVTNDTGSKVLLVIEVCSPNTARHDRVVKRSLYQERGVEYWIVDLDARLLERWTPDAERPEIITGALEWQPVGVATALKVDLDALFAEALGER